MTKPPAPEPVHVPDDVRRKLTPTPDEGTDPRAREYWAFLARKSRYARSLARPNGPWIQHSHVAWLNDDGELERLHEVLQASGFDPGDYAGKHAAWRDEGLVQDYDISASGDTMVAIAGLWYVRASKKFTSSGRVYAIDLRSGSAAEMYVPTSAHDWRILCVRAMGDDEVLVLSERSLRWLSRSQGSWQSVHRLRMSGARTWSVGQCGGRWVACVLTNERATLVAPEGSKLVVLSQVERAVREARHHDGAFHLLGADGAWAREEPPAAKASGAKTKATAKLPKLSLEPAAFPPSERSGWVPPSEAPEVCAKLQLEHTATRYPLVRRSGDEAIGLRPRALGDGYTGNALHHVKDGVLRVIELPADGSDFAVAPDWSRVLVLGPHGTGDTFFTNHLVGIELGSGEARVVLRDAFQWANSVQWLGPTRVLVATSYWGKVNGALLADLAEGEWHVRDRLELKPNHRAYSDAHRSQVVVTEGRRLRVLSISPEGRFGSARALSVPEMLPGGHLSLRFTEEAAYVACFRKRVWDGPEKSWRLVEG